MEFQDVVRRRRMIREYADTPVDDAVIDRALANAVRAPSAGFSQGWAFLVLDQPEDIEKFWAVTTSPGELPDSWLRGMQTAPVLIIPCSSKAAYLNRYAEPDKGWTDLDEARWPVPFWHMDAAMASLLILLTAVDEGLGACFFGISPEYDAATREAFGIPDDFDPVGVISIGHRLPEESPTGSPTKRQRKQQADVVHRGTW
jgi:nitroreductase